MHKFDSENTRETNVPVHNILNSIPSNPGLSDREYTVHMVENISAFLGTSRATSLQMLVSSHFALEIVELYGLAFNPPTQVLAIDLMSASLNPSPSYHPIELVDSTSDLALYITISILQNMMVEMGQKIDQVAKDIFTSSDKQDILIDRWMDRYNLLDPSMDLTKEFDDMRKNLEKFEANFVEPAPPPKPPNNRDRDTFKDVPDRAPILGYNYEPRDPNGGIYA